MAYRPYSPQKGAKYTLVGPDGTRAVWNDPTDADHVGFITEVTGLGSAQVRESAEDLPEADGGSHGAFYYGRRPIVLTAVYGANTSALARDTALSKVRRASNAMRGDAVLSWQNKPTASHPTMQTWVRRQQPFDPTGAFTKEAQLALVSQFAPLFGATLKTSAVTASGGSVSVENEGDFDAFPIIRILGPGTGNSTDPYVVNNTTGLRINTQGLTLTSGQWIDFDVLNHEAVDQSGNSANRYVNWGTTTWPVIVPGVNTFGAGGGGSFRITHRDHWV